MSIAGADIDEGEGVASILWHPDLHRQVAHEQLAFMTIEFHPRYQRDIALQIIDRATAAIGVRSYAVWELQRKPDVLLKIWLPAGKNPEDFWQSLREQGRNQPHVSLTMNEGTFSVLSTLAHYLWPRPLVRADIDEALHLGGDYLMSGLLSGDVPESLHSLTRRQIAAPISRDLAGVKFFIWVSVSELLPSEHARAALQRELLRVVSTTPHIFATSVYSGTGTGVHAASYIVTGRFKPDHYEVLARELQPRLAALGEPFIATNTDTALSTLFGPIDRVEALLPPEGQPTGSLTARPVWSDLGSLLELDESTTLEFKGSAFTAIPESGEGTRWSEAEAASRGKKVRDAIVKSVSGFLNASGGVLVIGAVEPERVSLEAARAYNPNAVPLGRYVVVGIDPKTDGRTLVWDVFERRLRELIGASITPSPEPWLEILKLEHEGVEVAVIVVDEPNTWFWANTSAERDVFYVRYGNATRPLRGAAQLHHIKSHEDRL